MLYASLFPKPVNTCMHCFTLKQGTVLIAIVHLFALCIAMTFCILALTHAVDIQEMVARDTEDAMDRGVFEDDNSMRVNMKRMKIASDNAKGKVDEIWFYLLFGIVHLIFIAFLFYGVFMNHRIFVMPWIYLNGVTYSVLIIAIVRHNEMLDLFRWYYVLIFTSVIIINTYSVYVVWSTYMSLNQKKGLIHEIHDLKKKQSQFSSECSTSTSRFATEPYEV